LISVDPEGLLTRLLDYPVTDTLIMKELTVAEQIDFDLETGCFNHRPLVVDYPTRVYYDKPDRNCASVGE